MNCLIIEDEPLAAEIIEDYVRQIPMLTLKGVCQDALAAMEVLHRESIDLIFLDIHLPGLRGLDFLETLSNPPAVIITTAYHEYALKGYDHNVIDYLLKPIEFKRFLQAVNKAKLHRTAESTKDKISIQSDKKTVIIATEDIVFIESQKEYIHIHTKDQVYISKYALSKIEEELNPNLFLRIHRSFLVSLSKVKAFNGQEVEVPGKTIPIGGHYKEAVTEKLHQYLKR